MSKQTKPDLTAIHTLLDERELELQTAVREAREAKADRPSSLGPQVEDAGEEGEQLTRAGIEHAEMQRHLEELQQIETAKARLAHGTYGECVDCEKTIAPERLLAQPTANRCIACQSAYEKSHAAR